MKNFLLLLSFAALFFTYISCSKSDPAPPSNPCAGVTINVTGSITPATSGQSNGAITATGSGSTGLTYSINGGAFQPSGTFTNLAAGSHTIVAKNGNGCTGTAQFTVGTVNLCAGVNIIVTGTVTNATAGNSDGGIVATATGSTGLTYSLNGGAFQATGTFTALASGVYTVTAKDANGCTGTQQFTVNTINPCAGVTITVSGTVTNATTGQNNGSITVTATGGSGFTYSIGGGPFQASGTFSNLAAGTYQITAKSSAGCTGSAQFTVTTINPCTGVTITVTTTTTAVTPCATPNGGISISATGGTGPYTYNLNGGTFQSSNVFSNLAAGTYTVIAKDANGCTQSASATVTNAATGSLFNAVKAVLASNCALSGCHAGPSPQNGLDFTLNCTIVEQASRIKARAVDGNPSFMPPPPNPQLSAADKQKIVNWVNAGGQATN